MNPKSFVTYLFILFLLLMFAYQSWRTVSKYLEGKTVLQVTTRDDDTILFPSITFCKKFMYTQEEFLGLLMLGKIDIKNAGDYFNNSTYSRSELIRFMNMNTVEGSNSFPCNTLTGLRPGAPCQFPFVFPDCSLSFKASGCQTNTTSVTFKECRVLGLDIPTCYTRTYTNTSAVLGQFAECRPAANCSSSVSMASALYNLTSHLYEEVWYEGVYGLDNIANGHCHTFNPQNVSVAGPEGQLYAYLGLPSSSLTTDCTRGFDIYLHERDQFWPGRDMESIGQTTAIDLELNNEMWGTFTTTEITKINKAKEQCVEKEEYSITECLMEFVTRSTGCLLDWRQSFHSDKYPACRSLEEIVRYRDLLLNISKLSWKRLTERSGCYGKCRYKKYTFTKTSKERITWRVSWSSAFFLSAEKTRVRLEEELEVFGVEDVVNGVGGALGLFLGWSVLYIVIESFKKLSNFIRFINWPFCREDKMNLS